MYNICNRSVAHLLTLTVGFALFAAACSSDDKPSNAAGGSPSTGGTTASGGSGTSTQAGSSSKAGSSATGGVAATGGASNNAGASATGGASSASTGGASSASTGGTSSTAGAAATGGSKSATGGTSAVAGASATGGAINTTGGATTVGGASNTGGVSANGGVSATGGASTAGGASTTGGASSTSTTAAACNALDLTGAPTVTPASVAQAAPTPAGGTIADGIYYQTAEITYTGVGGSTTNTNSPFKSVLGISGNTINQAGTDGSQFNYWTMTISPSGTTFTTQAVCGQAPNNQSIGYTFASGVLKVYVVKGSETQENTFTLKT